MGQGTLLLFLFVLIFPRRSFEEWFWGMFLREAVQHRNPDSQPGWTRLDWTTLLCACRIGHWTQMNAHTNTYIQPHNSITEHEQHGELIFFPLCFLSLFLLTLLSYHHRWVFVFSFSSFSMLTFWAVVFFFFFFCIRSLAVAPIVDHSKPSRLPFHSFVL